MNTFEDSVSYRSVGRAAQATHAFPARSIVALAAFALASGLSLLSSGAWAQTDVIAPTLSPVHIAPTAPVLVTPIAVTPDTSAEQMAKIMGTTVDVAQQIKSIDADRNTWTPAQRKLSSDFIYAARMAAGKPAAPGVQTLKTLVVPDARGRVRAVIRTSLTPGSGGALTSAGRTTLSTLQSAIAAVGGEILNNNGTEIIVLAPLANLETLAAQNAILTIRVYLPPHLIKDALGSSGGKFKPRALAPYRRRKKTPAEMRVMLQAFTGTGMPFGNFSLAGLFLNAADYNNVDTGVIGEGVTAHAVATAYNQFGVSGYNAALGRPIRIGVMSDDIGMTSKLSPNVTYLAESQTSNDLPATDASTYGTGATSSVTVAIDDTQSPAQTEDGLNTTLTGQATTGEGTAMMQIVHDMVPSAKIFFATASYSESQFAKNILLLRYKYNCDIICDDEGYLDESIFSDGIEAQAVNQVVMNGCFYFSSAGNEGHLSTYSLPNTTVSGGYTASVWEGDFVNGGSMTLSGTTGSVHAFATNVNYDTVNYPESSVAVLSWADPDQGTKGEYNVYAINGTTTAVGNTFSGTGSEPYQYVSVSSGSKLYVLLKSGTAVAFHLSTEGSSQPNIPSMTYVTKGQTGGHNCAPNAFGVAAAPATNKLNYGGPYPNAFSASSPSEYFSSDGPRTVFYTVSGGPSITLAQQPTGYTLPISTPTFTMIGSAATFASGGTVRQEPFITAADGVISSAAFSSKSGLNPFYGTSAAAPHAASVAALVMSYASNNIAATPGLTINGGLLSMADMHTVLQNCAIDIEASGYDATTGYGIVMPAPAIAFLQNFLYNNTVFAEPADTSATITWNTLLPATTVVNYGPTSSLGTPYNNMALTTSHNVTLTGLTPGKPYYYAITTTSANSSATYTDPTLRMFTTATATPPSLALTAASVTTSGGVSTATITLVNNGGAASAVTVTSASLAGSSTTTKLPDNLGSLAASASKPFMLTFPAVASGRTILKLSVTDGTGAVDNFSVKVTAP